ncbi:MAG: methyltransferase domain-containing protein [Erysipelothrix sp.]|nr:methyltransferase domain-containing protein [Erysipelothrix sp.]MBS3987448.1 methyltransferase domain-containing protein [Erysipelothrix sp.]
MLKTLLQCPVCHQPLYLTHHYSCGKHHFDRAKEGYVNLCIPPIRGDDTLLVNARANFFQTNPYKPLMVKLQSMVASFSTVLDVGCGTGAYLEFMKRNDSTLTTIGCDGSKKAIRKAAKLDTQTLYIVANMNALPLLNESVDVILSVFAPYNSEEIQRVLKPNGQLIVVQPAPNHLFELKQVLYDIVKLNPDTTLTIPGLTSNLNEQLEFEMILNQDELQALFAMTPYVYTSSQQASMKLKALVSLNIKASFKISVFTK